MPLTLEALRASGQPPREFAASRQPKVEVLLKSELVKRLPGILAEHRPR